MSDDPIRAAVNAYTSAARPEPAWDDHAELTRALREHYAPYRNVADPWAALATTLIELGWRRGPEPSERGLSGKVSGLDREPTAGDLGIADGPGDAYRSGPPNSPTGFPPRDLPGGDYAVIRSVGAIRNWNGQSWAWTGDAWTPAGDGA